MEIMSETKEMKCGNCEHWKGAKGTGVCLLYRDIEMKDTTSKKTFEYYLLSRNSWLCKQYVEKEKQNNE